MLMRNSAIRSTNQYMHLILQRSPCLYLFFHGQNFENHAEELSCIRFLSCPAPFPLSLISQLQSLMMSIFLTGLSLSQVLTMSWIWAIWTSPDCFELHRVELSSLPVPNGMYSSSEDILCPGISPKGTFFQIKSFLLRRKAVMRSIQQFLGGYGIEIPKREMCICF